MKLETTHTFCGKNGRPVDLGDGIHHREQGFLGKYVGIEPDPELGTPTIKLQKPDNDIEWFSEGCAANWYVDRESCKAADEESRGDSFNAQVLEAHKGDRTEIDPFQRRWISLKSNNCITNDPCAICGHRTDPNGLDYFLAGTNALVCDQCAQIHAPELTALMKLHWDAFGGTDENVAAGGLVAAKSDDADFREAVYVLAGSGRSLQRRQDAPAMYEFADKALLSGDYAMLKAAAAAVIEWNKHGLGDEIPF